MEQFSEIYTEYYPKLLRYARGFVDCHEDAENVLHDVFMDLWKNNSHVDAIINLNAYLRRLVRNRCLDFLKHKVYEKAYEERVVGEYRYGVDALDCTSDSRLLAGEFSSVLGGAVDKLPPRCKEIFLLSRKNGLSHGEIADTLNLSENTVSVQIGIALKRLRVVADVYLSAN